MLLTILALSSLCFSFSSIARNNNSWENKATMLGHMKSILTLAYASQIKTSSWFSISRCFRLLSTTRTGHQRLLELSCLMSFLQVPDALLLPPMKSWQFLASTQCKSLNAMALQPHIWIHPPTSGSQINIRKMLPYECYHEFIIFIIYIWICSILYMIHDAKY